MRHRMAGCKHFASRRLSRPDITDIGPRVPALLGFRAAKQHRTPGETTSVCVSQSSALARSILSRSASPTWSRRWQWDVVCGQDRGAQRESLIHDKVRVFERTTNGSASRSMPGRSRRGLMSSMAVGTPPGTRATRTSAVWTVVDASASRPPNRGRDEEHRAGRTDVQRRSA
jgi:hypothetical protein